MPISVRRLTGADLEQFIPLRLAQLAEEGAEPPAQLKSRLDDYYSRHLADGTFVSWLAEEEGTIIATSGMSFVEKPPWSANPSGRIGLLSGMYTKREYRRQGIARRLLDLVVQEARDYGCGMVYITASSMGELLYTSYGFQKNERFMQYVL